ncbi:MAG TPA: hypothetical protein VIZ28_08955, partial [Chitinophagaceae bacterium]
ISSGGGTCVHNADECTRVIRSFLQNEKEYKSCSERSLHYVWKNKGATEKIIQFIQEKRLLTI